MQRNASSRNRRLERPSGEFTRTRTSLLPPAPRELALKETAEEVDPDVRRIGVEQLASNPRNPRRRLDDIDELAESIRTHGLLQPLVVRPIQDHMEVVAGHRRLEAVRRLGWATVPCVVRDEDTETAYILTLVENLQRKDLTPGEEAQALEVLVRVHGWGTRQIAAAINRSHAYVSKRLRVFDDPILAPVVISNKLSVSAAEELLSVRNRRRYELLELAIEQQWDRNQVRRARQEWFAANQSGSTRRNGLAHRVQGLRRELRSILPTDLTAADQRELRLLFMDLAVLAKTKPGSKDLVFPPLPA